MNGWDRRYVTEPDRRRDDPRLVRELRRPERQHPAGGGPQARPDLLTTAAERAAGAAAERATHAVMDKVLASAYAVARAQAGPAIPECPPELLEALGGGAGGAFTWQLINAHLERMTALLTALLQQELDQVPEGIAINLKELVSETSFPRAAITFDPKLFSLVIINDGPEILNWRMPNNPRGILGTLNPGDSAPLTFSRARIGDVGLMVPSAPTNVRLLGTY